MSAFRCSLIIDLFLVNVTGSGLASSSAVQWNSRRQSVASYYIPCHTLLTWLNSATLGNPFNWIANKLNPGVRDKASVRDADEQARQKLARKGQLGLFESLPADSSAGELMVSKPKKKFTEVCDNLALKSHKFDASAVAQILDCQLQDV